MSKEEAKRCVHCNEEAHMVYYPLHETERCMNCEKKDKE